MLVTALSPLAHAVGANRIVGGKAVSHPFGDPTLLPDEERRYRRHVVERALAALATPIEAPTVFEPNE